MRLTYKIIALLLFSGLIFSCSSEKKQNESQDIEPDSFEAFYTRFHEDTAFQMSRITFPLAGIPAFADSASMYGDNYRWQKENWVYHRITDSLQQNFEREFIQLSDEVIIEYMTHKNAGIGMERRFGYLGDGWNLIYYAGMNYVRPKDQ